MTPPTRPVDNWITPATTRGEARRLIVDAFSGAGLDSPTLDARVLLCNALEISPLDLSLKSDVVIGPAASVLADMVMRRLRFEPVARICGIQEFWGLPFTLSAATLVPRPDTETLVEAALGTIRGEGRADSPLRILDLGTGSGCILTALLSELPAASGVGIDLSPEAARTARYNAAMNGVGARAAFLVGDWASAVAAPFDLIVSNPPYIETADIEGLAPDVRFHDPRLALDGGADGLAAYWRVGAEARRLLRPDGHCFVEVGAGQTEDVGRLLVRYGFANWVAIRDLAGIERVIHATPDRDTGDMHRSP
ncbi:MULTISPECIES: peptide chain release factor N(5)-glutamine methyltransferase [unclassified Chelatococcus]|uniref:peptide chain release factor N(5)-glutamine methyltransferase n=1 Tax=unclassified Chelatococcus TaxID=2638111 RepID=UPI001BCD08FF|nr:MULTISPECIES: peptide chain release factor N(5)-glutamine methyltransferase [unclassified Chelatococcus]MBS7696672.1 peptide chain release factor N(5)-glutamine methyltransferase [Chelatococcus sp. YT9]MBX3555237.1 peptide chain release factor N(5)-glutamine methyltransferase [Chelatococcus sp.]